MQDNYIEGLNEGISEEAEFFVDSSADFDGQQVSEIDQTLGEADGKKDKKAKAAGKERKKAAKVEKKAASKEKKPSKKPVKEKNGKKPAKGKKKPGFFARLNTMRIEKRLRTAFLLVAVIASISGLVAIGLMVKISLDSNNTLNNYGFASGDLGRALTSLTDTRRCVRDMVHGNEAGDVEEARQDLNKANEDFDKYFNKVKSTVHDSEGKDLVRVIEAELTNYQEMSERFASMGELGTMEDARVQDLMKTEMDPHYQRLYDACSELFVNKQERGNNVQKELILLCIIAIILVFAVAGIAMLVSSNLGKVISQNIAVPLEKTIHAAQSIAQGDLSIDISADTDDEVGDLNRAFLNMSANLKRVIADINDLLSEMASGNFDIETSQKESYVGELAPILESIRNINHALSDALSEINIATIQFSGASSNLAQTATGLAEGASDQAGAVDVLLQTVPRALPSPASAWRR